MSRYYEAKYVETALVFSGLCDGKTCEEVKKVLNSIPSIDIVLCKECKHRDKEHSYMCTYLNDIIFDNGDGFCCKGEREDE